MVTSLSDESALLAELRGLAERGHHQEVLNRLERLPADTVERRTAFALLAAEAHGRLGAYPEAERWAQAALVIARSRGERHAELRARNYKGAIALERAREIIGEMPPRQQEIALMRWQDRMKATEIAAALGVAEGTVHAHLHTARGKLVAGLEQYYPFGRDDGKGAAS